MWDTVWNTVPCGIPCRVGYRAVGNRAMRSDAVWQRALRRNLHVVDVSDKVLAQFFKMLDKDNRGHVRAQTHKGDAHHTRGAHCGTHPRGHAQAHTHSTARTRMYGCMHVVRRPLYVIDCCMLYVVQRMRY